MAVRQILVTGATGRQGKALISALRTKEDNPFHILALTRNASSPAAEALRLERHVTVIEGNLDSTESIRNVFEDAKAEGGVWGVFVVLAFPGLGARADGEEWQGKTIADLALEYGVSSFVFSSAERGGESYDDLVVLDRLAKVRIERHVRELGIKGLPWTILRPGFFMENYEGLIGTITVGVLRAGLKPTTTVQLVAVDDIGQVAAGVFREPEVFASEVLVVVGDILTMPAQAAAYQEATHRAISSIPGFLAKLLIYINTHTRGLITDMERVHLMRTDDHEAESDAQMAAARRAYPNMTSFSAWAARVQADPPQRPANWNRVSIARLMTGKH